MSKAVKVNLPVYWGIRVVLFTVYSLLFRFRHHGSHRVPSAADSRGVILAPNHASYLDPPITGISLKRPVTYLAKDYLFKAPVVGWTLRSVGALPIRTEAEDFRSIREVIRLLKAGGCITVFPEGTRSPDGSLRESEPGIGFLALKSGAWVVPAYIKGSFDAYPRGVKYPRIGKKVEIWYGEPFVPAEDPEITGAAEPNAAVGKKIMERIRKAKAEAESAQKK